MNTYRFHGWVILGYDEEIKAYNYEEAKRIFEKNFEAVTLKDMYYGDDGWELTELELDSSLL